MPNAKHFTHVNNCKIPNIPTSKISNAQNVTTSKTCQMLNNHCQTHRNVQNITRQMSNMSNCHTMATVKCQISNVKCSKNVRKATRRKSRMSKMSKASNDKYHKCHPNQHCQMPNVENTGTRQNTQNTKHANKSLNVKCPKWEEVKCQSSIAKHCKNRRLEEERSAPTGESFRFVRACARCWMWGGNAPQISSVAFSLFHFGRGRLSLFPSKAPLPPNLLSSFSWLYRYQTSNATKCQNLQI